MNPFFRPNIDDMEGYVPGEQPKPSSGITKLNTNENPYPPSQAAIAMLYSIDGEWLRRYPDPYANEFRRAVSDVLDVPASWVIAGNGSDDILNLVVRACAEADRTVAYPTPTYVLYRTLTEMQPANIVEVPYGEDLRLPIAELVAAKAAITFIASPNSPSGHVVPIADLRELARQVSGVLVIDEAYVDFSNETALPLANEFANVIVIRTLSKGYSLAGLRLGFGIAQPSLLAGLFKVKDSYNVDIVSCLVGAAAMRDQDHKNHYVQLVKLSRSEMRLALQNLGFRVWESQTNFLLVQVPPTNSDQMYAEKLYLGLKKLGILVRYFDQPGLDDKLRITIGTEAQNQSLLKTLKILME